MSQSTISQSTAHHLKTQQTELQRRYDTLTRRIAALDTDLGRELDSERKLVLAERRAELAAERERVAQDLERINQSSVEQARPRPAGDAVDKSALREAIIRRFGSTDLDLLCADVEQDLANDGIELQVNTAVVGGDSLPGQVLNLIQYLDRRGYLDYLVNAVRRARPGII
jgi:hypothetical protein